MINYTIVLEGDYMTFVGTLGSNMEGMKVSYRKNTIKNILTNTSDVDVTLVSTENSTASYDYREVENPDTVGVAFVDLPTFRTYLLTNLEIAGGGSSGSGATDAYTASGYSVTLGKIVNVTSGTNALDTLFNIQAQAPLVSLSTAPTTTLREFGNDISSVVLTANTTMRTNPITSVIFRRNGGVLHTVPAPTATGGTEIYTDTTAVTSNTTFQVTVSDGTLQNSSSRTFNFVYPFYWGVGAQALTAAQVQALTKAVESVGDKAVTTSPSTEVYYFAYPASYGDLTSILDPNGFETIDAYTKRTENMTMLDASSQSYFIYEFNNLTTQTNFINTYKF